MKVDIRNLRAEKNCQSRSKGDWENGEHKEAGCMEAMCHKNVPYGVERWQRKGKCPEEMMKVKSLWRGPDGGQHSISGWHSYHNIMRSLETIQS